MSSLHEPLLGERRRRVVLFTMQIPPDTALPSFIDLKDTGGRLAECLFVYTDQHRRCFGCGHTGPCQPDLPLPPQDGGPQPTLWSTLMLPA
jgi:hypothetical protein